MVELHEEILAQSPQNTWLVCQSFCEDAQVLEEFCLTENENIPVIKDYW